jgi:hypothetical protein
VNGQKGTVLVLVLWVLALLTLVGGFYAYESRIRRNLGQYAWDILQGREASRSLLLLSASKLISAEIEDEEFGLVADGGVYTVKFGGREVNFALEDENGKLDLNNSSEEQIREVVRAIWGSQELTAADTIVDSILDWRDTDKDPRPNGAEEDLYQDKSPPYYPSNGPFRLLEELILVHGVGQNAFYGPISWLSEEDQDNELRWGGGLWNLFTVYNKSGTVHKECAPLPIKEILSNEFDNNITTSGEEEILSNEFGDNTLSAYDVICLNVWFGNYIYKVYWSPQPGAEDYKIKHWTEAFALGSKDSR